ncbi:MAG: hypothetical protein QXU20_03510 [Candidatus Woesearchaeota archaeon]
MPELNKKLSLKKLSVKKKILIVFAIIVLSLLAYFIKRVLTPVCCEPTEFVLEESLMISSEELAKANARLTLGINEMAIKRGDKKMIPFAVKNEFNEDKNFILMGTGKINETGDWNKDDSVITCYASTADNPNFKKISFKTLKSYFIKKGETVVLNLEIRVARDASEGTYYCGFIIKDPTQTQNVVEYADKRFTIMVE